MTLILAIPASDRIIVGADGKTADSKTLKPLPDVQKVFELTPNCVALVAGMGIEALLIYMANTRKAIRKSQLTTTTQVTGFMQNHLKTRAWAGNEEAYIGMIIAGYDDITPKVFVIIHDGSAGEVSRYVMGNWDDAENYLFKVFGKKPFNVIRPNTAEKVAVEMLIKGEQANPSEIGGQGMLWHIKPSGIVKHDNNRILKLRARYTK